MKNQRLIGIKQTQLDEGQSDSSQPVPKVLDWYAYSSYADVDLISVV